MQSTEPEIWKPVVGYEGYYEVSDRGNVKRTAPARGTTVGRTLKQFMNANGYMTLRLVGSDHKSRPHRVHRIVAEAFHGEPQAGQTDVCHGNDNRTDNRAVNLRWGTRAENIREAVDRGRHYQSRKTHCNSGHEFTVANTRFDARQRVCLTCQRRRREEFGSRVTELRLQ